MAVATDTKYPELREQQREQRRRQIRRRRLSAFAVLVVLVAAALFGLLRLVYGVSAGAAFLAEHASCERVEVWLGAQLLNTLSRSGEPMGEGA